MRIDVWLSLKWGREDHKVWSEIKKSVSWFGLHNKTLGSTPSHALHLQEALLTHSFFKMSVNLLKCSVHGTCILCHLHDYLTLLIYGAPPRSTNMAVGGR